MLLMFDSRTCALLPSMQIDPPPIAVLSLIVQPLTTVSLPTMYIAPPP